MVEPADSQKVHPKWWLSTEEVDPRFKSRRGQAKVQAFAAYGQLQTWTTIGSRAEHVTIKEQFTQN